MSDYLLIVLGYLLGSIPFGYLIVLVTGRGDVRKTGSGGTGATNVSRRAGKALGVLTLILDVAKGFVAVYIAKHFHATTDSIIAATAIAVIVGHIFPVWLGFRGGKGVATGVGVFLALTPIALIGAGVVFVIIVIATRYISLGSILASATLPAWVWIQFTFVRRTDPLQPVLMSAVVIAVLIIFAHRENIARLSAGTESKFK